MFIQKAKVESRVFNLNDPEDNGEYNAILDNQCKPVSQMTDIEKKQVLENKMLIKKDALRTQYALTNRNAFETNPTPFISMNVDR